MHRSIEELKGSICERCGSKIDYIDEKEIGGNTYLYAIHVEKEEGKRRLRFCYLGPKDQYIYVSKLHTREGLNLRGLMSFDRALEYAEALRDYFRSLKPDDPRRKELARIGAELLEIAGTENIAEYISQNMTKYVEAFLEYTKKLKSDDPRRKELSRIGAELLEISGLKNLASEVLRISSEALFDIMQYFVKRKTKGMTKQQIERARELFSKVFSKGTKVIVVEG